MYILFILGLYLHIGQAIRDVGNSTNETDRPTRPSYQFRYIRFSLPIANDTKENQEDPETNTTEKTSELSINSTNSDKEIKSTTILETTTTKTIRTSRVIQTTPNSKITTVKPSLSVTKESNTKPSTTQQSKESNTDKEEIIDNKYPADKDKQYYNRLKEEFNGDNRRNDWYDSLNEDTGGYYSDEDYALGDDDLYPRDKILDGKSAFEEENFPLRMRGLTGNKEEASSQLPSFGIIALSCWLAVIFLTTIGLVIFAVRKNKLSVFNGSRRAEENQEREEEHEVHNLLRI